MRRCRAAFGDILRNLLFILMMSRSLFSSQPKLVDKIRKIEDHEKMDAVRSGFGRLLDELFEFVDLEWLGQERHFRPCEKLQSGIADGVAGDKYHFFKK